MSFETTKLTQTPDMQKAYARMVTSVEGDAAYKQKAATGRINKQATALIDNYKSNPQLNADQIRQLVARIEMQRKQALEQEKAMAERMVSRQVAEAVKVSEILCELGGPVAEKAALACLLTGTVRTPMDYKDVQKGFGADVSEILAEALEFAVYPERGGKMIDRIRPETKAMVLLEGLMAFDQRHKALDALGPDQMMVFSVDEIKEKFEATRALFGACRALDERYMQAFNALYAERLQSGVEMCRDENDRLVLSTEKVTSNLVKYRKDVTPKAPAGANVPKINFGPDGRIIDSNRNLKPK